MRRRLLLVALLACASPGVPQGAVLQSITVDGDVDEWAAVLADPFQRADDGPAGGLLDLDAPVQSTGRDLATFAWTYDPDYLYWYVARAGNTSNVQQFWFYVDTNADNRMETGEPVIGVAWKGSRGTTDVVHYTYNAASGAGDPLGDANGLADGWDMPGTLSLVAALESVQGGSADGYAMEARVSWGTLNVPWGSPLRFHVASSNSSNLPSQIDDNMGGPNGSVGSTLLGGVLLTPDGAGMIVPGGFAVLPHTATNVGQSNDRINLDWSASGDFLPTSVAFHLDADADGELGPGDPLLGDTDGDGLPDTPLLPPGASALLLAVPTAPSGVSDGQTSTIVLTASSSGAPLYTDTATDVVTVAIPGVTLVKSVDLTSAAPGDTITYSVTYTSDGSTDAHQVFVVDSVPAATSYVPGSAQGAGALIEFSHDGGASYDTSEAAPVTHIRWSFSLLTPGASGSVSFQVLIL